MIRPIKRKILVQKCTTGDAKLGFPNIGGIAIPEHSHDASMFAEILAVSEDCKVFTADLVGRFVKLPEWAPGKMHRVVGDVFIVREKLFTEVNDPNCPCAVFG